METKPATHLHDLKRRPVKLTGTALAIMCFQTLGVIYADIGTSPL